MRENMTAEIDESFTENADKGSTSTVSLKSSNATSGVEPEIPSSELHRKIEEIFHFLSLNNKIIFKSQQIDDPELLRTEKIQIAREIYNKNRGTFLMRFGSYLEEKHLTEFEHTAIEDDEHNDEIELLLADYRNKLRTRKRDVKNRRYAAMQQLIAGGEYFSELEMMKRAPELYQELIGQYLNDAEKKQRDEYDVKNTSFSGILMHTMEQQQLQDVLKQADKQNIESRKLEIEMEGSDCDEREIARCISGGGKMSNEIIEAEKDMRGENEIPDSFRQQWGNFDNEQVACSTSRHTSNNNREIISKRLVNIESTLKSEAFITAGERELLRQEFVGLMHEQFLCGGDSDFDYTEVDDNTQLDDFTQINQDKEDAYFEESDYSSEDEAVIRNGGEEHSDNDVSEDELDVFMDHLNRHHSLLQ